MNFVLCNVDHSVSFTVPLPFQPTGHADLEIFRKYLIHVYQQRKKSLNFFITKQTSLHPFDFVRNLFHLLVYIALIGVFSSLAHFRMLVIASCVVVAAGLGGWLCCLRTCTLLPSDVALASQPCLCCSHLQKQRSEVELSRIFV